MPEASEITRLLDQSRDGHPEASERLLKLVYEDLRSMARRQLDEQAPGHTLQPTALVHEAYARMAARTQCYNNREHFLAIAAKAMRCVLIDHARAKGRGKRGGGWRRVALDAALAASADRGIELVALNEALDKLGRVNEIRARLVEMRFFGGLTLEEASVVLGTSLASAKREWAAAKVWLFRELRGEELVS